MGLTSSAKIVGSLSHEPRMTQMTRIKSASSVSRGWFSAELDRSGANLTNEEVNLTNVQIGLAISHWISQFCCEFDGGAAELHDGQTEIRFFTQDLAFLHGDGFFITAAFPLFLRSPLSKRRTR